MQRVLVHQTVNIIKSFEIYIPNDVDPEDFIETLSREDPACISQFPFNVFYIPETEEPISVRYYLVEQHIVPSKNNKSMKEQCRKIALYIAGKHKPLEALQRLKRQALVDGDVPADCIIRMAEHLEKKYTVNELLDVLQAKFQI